MITTPRHVLVSSGSETSDSEGMADMMIRRREEQERSKAKTGTSRGGRRHSSRSRPSSRVPQTTKHFVNHSYHDHLHDPVVGPGTTVCDPAHPTAGASGLTDEESTHTRRGSHRGGVATPFPEKLYYMLSRMTLEGTDSIVSWQPHGRCFAVHKPKEFVEEVMPM
jgi:HSF-type DNA-binding